MATVREPLRTCLGCRQVRVKAALLRLVRAADGQAEVDWEGRRAGRGAYVCPSAECLARALTKARLGHAFKDATAAPAVDVEAVVRRWSGSRANAQASAVN
jgi:hypothetical protein